MGIAAYLTMAFAIYSSLILAVSALSASVRQDFVSGFELPRCSLDTATEGLVVPGNVTVEKNRLAGVFPEWGPVLRVTDQGAENSTYVPGRSIPAVWLCSSVVCGGCPPKATCLIVASYISNDWNEQVCLNISRDRFVSIEIAQLVMDGVYFYHVYMDGKLFALLPNGAPANFTRVNVFTSDNYDRSFGDILEGQLRNLEVATWHQQPTDCYISKP